MNKDKAFDELYKLAKNCAEYNYRGCNNQCGQCGYNVYFYTNERDATLIKSNAYAEHQKYKELEKKIESDRNAEAIAPLIILSIIVGLIMWCCK
ncbi:hypothetical protein [Treponema sp. R6D11]